MPRKMMLAALFGGASLLPAATAWAQTQASQPLTVGEIVVTAQKRAENLQTTPLAVSALPAEKLEKLNVHSAQDLSSIAPNVTVLPSSSTPVGAIISMRGIPNPGSETFGFDNANGLYIDGVYIARSANANLDVADIQRVEVLRGPQGTLFGRNTTGGAVSFITRDPSRDFRFVGNAGVGNYGAWSTRLSVDPGDFHGLRTSFSYMHRQRDGVVDNIQAKSSEDPGSYQIDAARVAAMFDIRDTGSVRYAFDYTMVRGHPLASQMIAASNGAFRPPILGIPATQPAPVQPFLNGVTFLDPRCAAFSAPTLDYRDTLCLQDDGGSKDVVAGHTLRIENDFGPFSVKSTTGYRTWTNRINNNDFDGLGAFRSSQFTNASLFNGMPAALLTPILGAGAAGVVSALPVPTTTAGLFATANDRGSRQFSQELEFARATDNYDAVAGFFYFREEGHESNPQNSAFVLDTNTVLTSARFGALAAGLQAANPARYRVAVTNALLRYNSTSESEALYGQFTYYPDGRNGRWSLTGGLRYTWDQKSLIRFQNGATAPATPDTGDGSFTKLTWNFMAGYKLTPDVNLYGRIARGYRSGGFNTGDVIPAGSTTIPPFAPETVDSFEIGAKNELFDRRLRLNVAAFYNMYDNLLVIQPIQTAGGTFGTHATNAGKVIYSGFEMEANAVLTENWSLDGTLGYTDVHYDQFLFPNGSGQLVDISSIAHAGYVAPLTANFAVNYRRQVFGESNFFARLGYTHEGKKYSFNNVISSPFGDIASDPRNVVDMQLGLDHLPFGPGQTQVKFWVRNLTDSHGLLRTIDFGQLGYATGQYEEPRTFGFDVTYQF